MISGNYISELQEFPLNSSMNPTDLFICSQRDKYVHNWHRSVGLESYVLINEIIDEIISLRKFGSMVSCESSAYSRYDHNHDDLYNKLSIDFYEGHPSSQYDINVVNVSSVQINTDFAGYPIKKSSTTSYLSIGNLFVDGTLSTIYLPMSCVFDYAIVPWQIVEPEVGTIKFGVVPKDSTNINYKSPDFDGWLYPDGKTYDLSDFSLSDKIASLYGNDDEQTFTIPTLSNFIRLNGIMLKQPSIDSFISGHNALSSHSHNLKITDATGKITVRGTVPYSENVTSSNATIHWGNGCTRYVQGYDEIGQKIYSNWIPLSDLSTSNSTDAKNWREKHNLPKKISKDNRQQVLNWIENHIYESNDIILNCSCDIDIRNISIDNYSNNMIETYPSYYDMPVMVYVGRRKRLV